MKERMQNRERRAVLVLFLLDRVKILVPSAEVAKLSGLKILKTSEVRSG